MRSNSVSVEDVKDFLSRKAFGFSQSFENDRNHVRALALMGYRCQFFINLQSLAEQLSYSYLRFVADINDDRTLVRTVQPSELFLSWLAPSKMGSSEVRLSIAKALLHHTQSGIIDTGDIGELVGSIILLFAFDKAHGQSRPRPIAVSDLSKSLFSDYAYKALDRECKKKSGIREIWNGPVFFSHFARTQSKDRRVTVDILRRAYARNAALIAPSAFKGCDLIIPILLNSPRRMSYVLIQVKNDKSLTETDKKNEKSLTTLSPHEKLDDPKSPFIGICMSLQGKPPSSKFLSKSAVKVVTKDLPKKLVASGVRGAVYPALGEGTMADKMIMEKLQTLLGCTDHINVVGESQYLQGLYPIDDESL